MSGVHELLSDTALLRGRAVIDLRLDAFDHPRQPYLLADRGPADGSAFHAVLGGAPATGTWPVRPHPNDGFVPGPARTLHGPGRAAYSRTET